MLCDRDAVPFGMEPPADPVRFRVLPRYHLENYFLDEGVWVKVFKDMEADGSWLRDHQRVRAALEQIAKGLASYSAALVAAAATRRSTGSIDIMPKDCHGKTQEELLDLLVERATVKEHASKRNSNRIRFQSWPWNTWRRLQPVSMAGRTFGRRRCRADRS